MSVLATPQRNSYIDSLRALAVTRVFLHHVLWIGWLTVLFPSMPVMFALAGYLTAVTLDRRTVTVMLRSRLRRLLPPLWMLAAVAIPLMLANGWLSDQDSPLRWEDLSYWILPLANPPASTWGGPFALTLWYLRAYLWFVLLSPLLWWLFRRWPLPTLLTPLAATIVFYSPLMMLPVDRVGDVVWSTAAFGTCWMLGFARHTGLLTRIPVRWCLAAGAVLAAAAAAWGAIRQADPAIPWMFADPLAETLWGTGYVIVLMRLEPGMAWLQRLPRLHHIVTFINARAVTIYLWHLPALYATTTILASSGIDIATPAGIACVLAVATALLAMIVAAVGWVEDLAARRRPTLIPTQRYEPATSRPATHVKSTPTKSTRRESGS